MSDTVRDFNVENFIQKRREETDPLGNLDVRDIVLAAYQAGLRRGAEIVRAHGKKYGSFAGEGVCTSAAEAIEAEIAKERT